MSKTQQQLYLLKGTVSDMKNTEQTKINYYLAEFRALNIDPEDEEQTIAFSMFTLEFAMKTEELEERGDNG